MLNITNEDNMELMSRYEDNYFDLAIIDPPYGIERLKKKGRFTGEGLTWDNKPKKEYFDELCRVSRSQIIWGANNFGLEYKGFVVWRKKSISLNFNMSMCEIASLSEGLSTISKMFEFIPQQKNRIHPTQKPIELYEFLLERYAKQADKILDTHLGSGSIAIACHNLGYDLTACELDKEYYEAAMQRIKEHKAQLRLL